ncbi:MAG: Copper amine oxidase N-terminal domain [Chthonomonadaceae bacterium]|nr:Copper amine oxidase N-terminal domain [Chthonomonadaceae bacterium]
MNYTKYTTMMTGGAVAATLLFSQIAPAAAQGNRTFTLESGTVIPVKLRDTLSSTDSRKGDRFVATLESEDTARSLNLPLGTEIQGTVASVRPMRDKDPGVIALNFNRVVLPNEASYPIQGSLIGLDDKSVTHTSNGRLVAKDDHKNKTLLYAGYGAGAGLILGAITKGNTILDTLIGGGLGYLLGTQDKSHGNPRDVTLKPGTEMGVRLDRSVRITTNDNGSYNDSSIRPRNDRNADGTYGNGDRSDRNSDGSYRIGDGSAADSGRDLYDNDTLGHQSVSGADTYRVLNQFTDIRDNGQPVRVIVEDRPVSFLSAARPFIANGVVMVPAVPVLKAAHVRYSYTANQFTADGPGEPLTVTIGSRIATGSNTHRFDLPATVRRRNGTLYVPMQFLAIVTGQKLTFDRDSQTVGLGTDNIRSASYPH